MSTQMDALIAEIAEYPHALAFDRNDFGEGLAELNAACIYAYMDMRIGPDNTPWIELSLGYEAWKSAHYPGRDMAELHLVMKDPDQLRGELTITATTLVQTYGTNDTARQEAAWFQEGSQGQARPPRPFYGFNDLALAELAARCDQRFDDATR